MDTVRRAPDKRGADVLLVSSPIWFQICQTRGKREEDAVDWIRWEAEIGLFFGPFCGSSRAEAQGPAHVLAQLANEVPTLFRGGEDISLPEFHLDGRF